MSTSALADLLARRWWWGTATLALMFAAAFKLLDILWDIAHALALLIIAVVLAESLRPAANKLGRWLPRAVAVTLIYLFLALVLALLGWVVFPPLITQVRQVAERAPDIVSTVEDWIDNTGVVRSSRLEGQVRDWIANTGLLTSFPFTVSTVLVETVAVIFMSVYWLLEADRLRHFVLSLLPETWREPVRDVLAALGHAMGGYVRGVVLDGAIVGLLAYTGLLVIGVDNALALGLFAFLGELIPVLGPFLAAVPAIGVALLHSPTQALIVVAFYVILQQLEGHLITPNIMRSQTDVPQMLVVFAFLAGAALGGFVGVIVAIPLSAALNVLVQHALAPAIRHGLGVRPPGDESSRASPGDGHRPARRR